ncbi:MAG: hypothetical protein GF405_11190 [Candidatus Eisenbacteria bacterium]|nr:hypothetical protein [Candidatus Eisenbacteria bacterium]
MSRTTVISLIILMSITAGIAGCGGGETYGEPLSNAAVTPVSEILADPASFGDDQIKIEGEIVRECPSGCWFELEDDGAAIHVDIAPSGLAIPQKVGGTATVEGVVLVRDGRTMLVGSGVMIR